mgnify:FL=1
MEILKEALERNGFTYIGPCKICGGRGFEYQNKRIIAKIKKDSQMRELHITVNGWDHRGKRIAATLIDKKIPAHMENIDNILKQFTTDATELGS